MQENRRLRLQSAIQEELSQFVAREVKDPRIPPITFTEVQVTQDGSHATIFVSILGGNMPMLSREFVASLAERARNAEDGDEEPALPEPKPMSENATRQRMKDCLDGLQKAQGFIRRHLGKVLNVRHIPTLAFKEDRGFENASTVHSLLVKLEDEAKQSKKGEGNPS